MVQLNFKPHRGQQPLLDACTSSRPPLATAVHLSRRADRDRRIGFADVATLPDPDWANAAQPGRYEVAGLVPAGQLAVVPLTPPAPEPDTDPQPVEELLAEDSVLSAERRAGLAAAEWVDAAVGTVMAQDCAAVLDAVAARPELLAPLAHPGPRLWLRRIAALLDEPLPGTDWAADLAAVLPVRVEQLKGAVA